jgi:Cu(I)/Ag(I) efflux system membrane fusion protein
MTGKLVAPLAAALAFSAFLAGRITGSEPPAAVAAATVAHYQCPMHPGYTSDRAGACPQCGMKLTAIGTEAPAVMPGVRTVQLRRTSGVHRFRTLGRVAAEETRIQRVTTGSEGWIREVYPAPIGSFVRKDQPLASFYGRDFIASQQSYFYALGSLDREHERPTTQQQGELIRAQVEQARETLEALGMGPTQLDEIARTRVAAKDIVLRSPVDGIVLASDALAGQRFEKFHELYRIADLRRVWVVADLYEREARFLRAGGRASITPPGSGAAVRAEIADSLPRFDGGDRVFKLRLEASNPGFTLRPDMLADVEIALDLPESLTLPDDAVVETGRARIVFVASGGRYAPRQVETGWRMDGQVQITRGLEPGESVALGANFLLDSDSRLRLGHD